ncbi:MAG: universal stress protein [Blastococcus sp.]|nr:universal stress protein [Blastococcus sp.]
MSTSTATAPPGAAIDGADAAARTDALPAGDAAPPTRDVVVGVDGSECAIRAVRWAAREAVLRGAPLRIVHAASYLGRRAAPDTPSPELARARQITGQAFTAARHTEHDLHASTEVTPGDAVDTLLRAAATGQLVVLGSSTTGAVDELVRAPVAARLAARSPSPVIVVPRQRTGVPAGRSVAAVLGIGDPEDDEAVAAFATAAARRRGLPLVVVQTRGQGRTAVSSRLDDVAEWSRREPDLDVRHSVLPRASAGPLVRATCPSSLLVISAGHGHLLHRTLDGPHRWLLRHCTSPMAFVPPVHRRERDPREEIVALG